MINCTILIVEDEKPLRKNICEYLSILNYVVIEAENGKEALTLLNQFKIDLIITDLMMPEMDGLTFVKEVRNNYAFENLPILFLSAKSEMQNLREGLDSGADDYFTKPISLSDLEKQIQKRLLRKIHLENLIHESLVKQGLNISKLHSHELNTPLTGILGAASLLVENHEHLNEQNKIDLYKIILTSGKRLHQTINNILLFKELQEKEAPKLPSTQINIAHLIRIILQEKVAKFKNKKINIVLPDYCELFISETPIQIILSEIIDNQFKFSNENSLKVISWQELDNLIWIHFENQGQPFANKDFNAVKPLVQFNKEIYQQQGMGLGLHISKELCKRFNILLEHQELKEGHTRISLGLKASVQI